jgi:hypothetical protein
MDEIVTFFPGLSRARVRVGLARFLGASEGELHGLLAELGDEIVFHVSTDPGVRAEIRRSPPAKRAGRVAAKPGGPPIPSRLARTASAALRERT